MIIAVCLAGFRLRPRPVRIGLPLQAAVVTPANLGRAVSGLKRPISSARRKLPLRGRIWGALIPPWPNYESGKRKKDALKSRK